MPRAAITAPAESAALPARVDAAVKLLDSISPLPVRLLVAITIAAAAAYGAVMGSWRLDSAERWLLPLYVAIKTPLLIYATTLVCLPGYFVLNTVLGLRAEFAAALRAILAGQAAMAVALVSLAPITKFIYVCGADKREALLFNAAAFTIATLAAQVVTFRRYRPLIALNRGHILCLWFWLVAYAFVGTQAGWMLRPFVGTPSLDVAFLRDEPFSNAYVVVWKLIAGP
jgi:hypothetical protein